MSKFSSDTVVTSQIFEDFHFFFQYIFFCMMGPRKMSTIADYLCTAAGNVGIIGLV